MDTKTRAENIFTLLNLPAKYDPKNGIPKGSYDAVLAELDDAQHDILEQSEPVVKLRIFEAVSEYADALKDREMAYEKELKMRVEKAVREAKDARAEFFGCKEAHEKSFNEGFAAAREKAAGIADRWANKLMAGNNSRKIAERIRAMEADK